MYDALTQPIDMEHGESVCIFNAVLEKAAEIPNNISPSPSVLPVVRWHSVLISLTFVASG